MWLVVFLVAYSVWRWGWWAEALVCCRVSQCWCNIFLWFGGIVRRVICHVVRSLCLSQRHHWCIDGNQFFCPDLTCPVLVGRGGIGDYFCCCTLTCASISFRTSLVIIVLNYGIKFLKGYYKVIICVYCTFLLCTKLGVCWWCCAWPWRCWCLCSFAFWILGWVSLLNHPFSVYVEGNWVVSTCGILVANFSTSSFMFVWAVFLVIVSIFHQHLDVIIHKDLSLMRNLCRYIYIT